MEYNRKITAKAPVWTTNHTFSHDFSKFICIFRNIFVPLRQILENCVVMATEQTQKEQEQSALQRVFCRTWEAAMRLKGSVVVNDARLFL